MQFPSSSDMTTLREAVFDVGMFAVTILDSERSHGWDRDSHAAHGRDPSPSRRGGHHVEGGTGKSFGGSGSGEAEAIPEGDEGVNLGSGTSGSPFGGALNAFALCALSGRLLGRIRTVELGQGVALRTTLATATNGADVLPLFPPLKIAVGQDGAGAADPTAEDDGPPGRSRSRSGHADESRPGSLGGESPCEALERPAERLRAAVDSVGRSYARLLDRLVHGVASR